MRTFEETVRVCDERLKDVGGGGGRDGFVEIEEGHEVVDIAVVEEVGEGVDL